MFKKISISLMVVMGILVASISFADHLTADPQPNDIIKYRIDLNGEVRSADIENVGGQVQIYYNIDHLSDGRHIVAAAAGNAEGEWSDWSKSLTFYRGVPTPENIYLFCGGVIEEPTEDPMRISRDNWEITYVSSEDSEKGKFARLAIDGNINTYWRTDVNYPHEIHIDLGEIYRISGFYYLARQDAKWNGTIKEFTIFGSMDGISWTELAFGELSKTRDEQLVEFAEQSVRYISLTAISEVDGGLRAVCSEFNILGY